MLLWTGRDCGLVRPTVRLCFCPWQRDAERKREVVWDGGLLGNRYVPWPVDRSWGILIKAREGKKTKTMLWDRQGDETHEICINTNSLYCCAANTPQCVALDLSTPLLHHGFCMKCFKWQMLARVDGHESIYLAGKIPHFPGTIMIFDRSVYQTKWHFLWHPQQVDVVGRKYILSLFLFLLGCCR